MRLHSGACCESNEASLLLGSRLNAATIRSVKASHILVQRPLRLGSNSGLKRSVGGKETTYGDAFIHQDEPALVERRIRSHLRIRLWPDMVHLSVRGSDQGRAWSDGWQLGQPLHRRHALFRWTAVLARISGRHCAPVTSCAHHGICVRAFLCRHGRGAIRLVFGHLALPSQVLRSRYVQPYCDDGHGPLVRGDTGPCGVDCQSWASRWRSRDPDHRGRADRGDRLAADLAWCRAHPEPCDCPAALAPSSG